MNIGDLVRVQLGDTTKYGVIVQESKKMFMVGEVLKVLVEGEIKTVLKDKLAPIKLKTPESESK